MFSSHERLRLALGQYQLQHGRKMSSSSTLLHSADNSRSTGRLRKSPLTADQVALSQVDAHWFLSLPETVKRKNFTQEERKLLEARCQTVIMDAADESIFRMGGQANRSCGTLDSSSSTVSHKTAADPPSPSDDVDLFDWRNSFRWLDEGDDLDLRLNIEEFHYPCQEKAPPPTPYSDHSRRRSLSLSAKPSQKSFTPPQPLGGGRRCSNQFTGRPSLSSVPRTSMQVDPDATYYQDPEARLKLRVYLASAQKFDEAIEFGFPSSKDSRPATAVTGSNPHTLLRQDQSFLDDDDDESQKSSSKRPVYGVSPFAFTTHKPVSNSGHYPLTSPGNREMTLRMTLTRPDLRADENQLYGWKKEIADPLALEPLPPVSDTNSGMGPFDIPPWAQDEEDPGLVRKLWRKVRGPISSRR